MQSVVLQQGFLGKANAWLADAWLNLPGRAQRAIGIQLETYAGLAFAARQEKLLE